MSNQSANEMRRLLLEMGDNMTAILDAVDGYKAKIEERGYSPTVAEAMAMEYHHELLRTAFSGGKS